MHVPDRVHIIPLGYEFDRVLEPPRRLKANTVVLVHHLETESNSEPTYYDDLRDQLRDIVHLEETACDLFDLYACLEAIVREITKHQNDEVYVNLATGSKVTAIAGMIACMATDARPYYVRAKRYGRESEAPPEKPVSSEVAGIDELPTYPIGRPSEQHIRVLSYLSEEKSVTKKELIEYGDSESLPFLDGYNSDNDKGKYRRLDTHILESLVDNGYVTIEEVGRNKRIQITEEGENTLRAFRYLVD